MNKVEEGILYAVGGIDDPDVLLKLIKKADRRRRALGYDSVVGTSTAPAVNLSDINTGDTVIIGTEHGQKTRVEVITVNRKRVKVRLLEPRGTKVEQPAGTEHDFYPEMIREVVAATATPAATVN